MAIIKRTHYADECTPFLISRDIKEAEDLKILEVYNEENVFYVLRHKGKVIDKYPAPWFCGPIDAISEQWNLSILLEEPNIEDPIKYGNGYWFIVINNAKNKEMYSPEDIKDEEDILHTEWCNCNNAAVSDVDYATCEGLYWALENKLHQKKREIKNEVIYKYDWE